ncbi:hypothetical protein EPUS_01536 [Endocarpon pusillum Z07020]|uniref:Vacuolar calcium ion transporter n=1 Tax=Endocarpon pusillum (strain Z07020 / HMAS-L-300199) TaxID=1263415 RepID=U1GUK0_ENDPU|nr:uncharacterized protein EPUS_01536 [Endocarpon pusillum Z07020]ERF75706.1 hypothetical protein EPUS_01536 [Endocarpon pusillum Z07020]
MGPEDNSRSPAEHPNDHEDAQESQQLLPTFNHHTGLNIIHSVAPEGESGRHGFDFVPFCKIMWKSSSQVSMLVNVLWPFAPIAIILHYGFSGLHIWIFAMSYIGMVAPANLLGFAGQELARKMPKVTGVLVETALGSIVEIILFLILIKKHSTKEDNGAAEHGNLIPVIQAAILGSILTNLLLCLGLCFFVGGLRQQSQKFHAAVSEVGTGLLLVAGFGLLIPSAFYSSLKSATVTASGSEASYGDKQLRHDTLKISQITSIILIIAFFIYIWFNARSHDSIFDEVLASDEERDRDRHSDHAKAKFTFTECVVALVISLTFVCLLAEFLVEQIPHVVDRGVPDQFLGLILLPLVEKAAEHLTAIDEAWDDQMNFALYHCLSPSIQTALFNAPLVVIVGWILNKPMDLNFEIFMIALLVLSILVIGNFLRDGESNYLEGALLVIIYLICAVAAWYYPDPDVATSNGGNLVLQVADTVAS